MEELKSQQIWSLPKFKSNHFWTSATGNIFIESFWETQIKSETVIFLELEYDNLYSAEGKASQFKGIGWWNQAT